VSRPGDQPTYRNIGIPVKEVLIVAVLGGFGFAWWWLSNHDVSSEGAAGSILEQVNGGALPPKVFEGGNHVRLWATLTQNGSVRVMFKPSTGAASGQQPIERTAQVKSGEQVFDIDVASGVSGSVEVCIDKPNAPATVEVSVEGALDHTVSDKQEISEPSQKPLCASLELSDWGKATAQ
jgi:hypothetical protein